MRRPRRAEPARRPVKARTLLKLFKPDEAKKKRIRRDMLNKDMVRRDNRGKVVARNELREHKPEKKRRP